MENLQTLVQREFDLGETAKSLTEATGVSRITISNARHGVEIAPENARILREQLEARAAKRREAD